MGNCIAVPGTATATATRFMVDDGLLKIVKTDGKVLEYGTSISVSDLLSEFDGFAVGVSRHASHLPPDHEMKTGKVYFLLPLNRSGDGVEGSEARNRCTRIKVVLTKQQLQELLLKVDVEDMLLTLKEEQHSSFSYAASWKPQLESIQE